MTSTIEALATRPIDRLAIQPADIAPLGARWSIRDGALRLALPGPGMRKTSAAVAYAGALADDLDHHPDIELAYRGLALSVNTHDANAITTLDLIYAARLELWLRANGWPA